MKVLAVVQARMSSTRLPGKVLRELSGKPMIIQQLERIQRANLIDQVVVATSTDPEDDILVEVVSDFGVDVVRGDLHDVLSRFIQAVDRFSPEVVVRLTADCPLTSPVVIDAVIQAFALSNADYLSNTMKPTFPDGLDVEVVKADVLRKVSELAMDEPEREHVTLGVYRRPELFAIENYEHSADLSSLRWTVDTAEDFSFVQGVYSGLYTENPQFDLAEVLDYLKHHPALNRTDRDSKRNAALDGIDTGVMNA